MIAIKFRLAGIAAAGLAACIATPASAGTGCSGVVNIFVSGCAAWDNNNAPKFPCYREKLITIPRQAAQTVTKDGVRMALRNGTYYPLVGTDGGTLIGNDGGSFHVWTQ